MLKGGIKSTHTSSAEVIEASEVEHIFSCALTSI